MRRTYGFVLLWFVAGAVATTIAWLGVSTVSDQLAGSGSHPDPLSPDEIASQVASEEIPDPTTTTTTTIEPASTTTTEGEHGGQTGTSPTTTAPSSIAPPTTAAPSPAAQPVTRSYDLEGGTATLRFSPSGVTVVVATPAPGFTVDIGDSHSGGKRVEFESSDHRSRLDAWWDGGPQDEIREDS